jgi:small subunit ribosomal protein S8
MHDEVLIPRSKIKESIARILADEGYVDGFEIVTDESTHPLIKIHLRYSDERERAIAGIRRISKPGRRIYRGAGELPRVLGGMGVAIISTSQGVMTDKQARRARVGGEVLAYVW